MIKRTIVVARRGSLLLAIGALLAGCAARQKTAGIHQYIQGIQAVDAGDRQQAIADLSGAIHQNPDLIMPRIVLGDLYYNGGQIEKAAEQYKALTKLDPYASIHFYKLGLTQQVLNHLQEAAAAYRRALKLSPDDFKTNMNLGLVYLALSSPEEAVHYLSRAVEIEPRSAAALANLGVAYDSQGDYGRAEAVYRKSLELDSDDALTKLNLGSNLILQHRTRPALALLEEAVKALDTPLAHKRYGDALAQAKRYDAAAAEYQTALRRNPRYYPALNELGSVYIAQYIDGLRLDEARRRQAVSTWEKSLSINPDQPRITRLVQDWNTSDLPK